MDRCARTLYQTRLHDLIADTTNAKYRRHDEGQNIEMTRGKSDIVIDERDECEVEDVEDLRIRTAPQRVPAETSPCAEAFW